MPASKSEQILDALKALLETVPDAVVDRNSVLPEKVPAAGLIILRDGDPGERASARTLLAATERGLSRSGAAIGRRHRALRGGDRHGRGCRSRSAQGRQAIDLKISDDRFTYRRKPDSIAAETRLDRLYVVRTSLPAYAMSAADAVDAYKALARVGRAFRSLKSIDLPIRPVHHWIEPRVRAHVFLCMLAYYVEWHLRRAWAPILFDGHDRAAAEAARASPVAAAEPSPASVRKRGRRTDATCRSAACATSCAISPR